MDIDERLERRNAAENRNFIDNLFYFQLFHRIMRIWPRIGGEELQKHATTSLQPGIPRTDGNLMMEFD